MSTMETTWDGLPIAPDNPRGAGVVVRHPSGTYLLLHRHHNGPEYEGDWAWTSPSGARLPGEPVLACAERELYEESGLAGLELRPVDLSGRWAVFAATAPDTAAVVIDHEHDRFEWLPFAPALERLAPPAVVDNFQRGATVALPALTLRPLTRDDFPAMLEWFAAPHVAQWFPGPSTLPEAEAKYGPRIDGTHRVRVHVLEVDGTAAGFLQCYPDAEDVAIDYVIGSAALVGTGLGPQAIWVYLRDVVLPMFPAAPRILASPKADNLRSVRALEKAGFVRTGETAVPTEHGIEQQTLCVLDHARIFG